MLEGSIVFNLSGAIQNYNTPDLVVGDKNSVKLKVRWLDHETLQNFKDLTEYVVEGVYTRPDGKVSPALTFSIDQENNTIKYLVFGNWLTEIAGVANLTVRFKQNDEVKATGQITFVIQDGKQPSDVVISEPQHEALQESIQAEENARKQAISGLQNEFNERKEAVDNSIDGLVELIENLENKINDLEDTSIDDSQIEGFEQLKEDVSTLKTDITNLSTTLNGLSTSVDQELNAFESVISVINNSIVNLQNQIDELEQTGIDQSIIQSLQSDISSLQQNLATVTSTANSAVSTANLAMTEALKKLDKDFSGLTQANAIADNDYIIINSNSAPFKVPFSLLREILGSNGSAVNNYLGDFDSIEALTKHLTDNLITPQDGNYAYIKGTDGVYVMYLYIDGAWSESASGKYVLTTTFDSFKNQLGTGEYAVKAAQGYYYNGIFRDFVTFIDGLIDAIRELQIGTTYDNSTPTPQAIGGIPKGTTFDNKPIKEILGQLLYPYVAFSASISMYPKNGGVVKTQNNQTVTGCTVSITKGSAEITKIEVKYGNSVKATKTSNIGTSNTFTFDSAITITSSSSSKNLTAVVTDETGASKTATSSSFTFVDPYYYGVTTKAASELTINDILSMTEDVKTKGSKSYSYTMNQQRAVIAYPASYGNLSSIKDANNFEVLDTFNKVTINNYGADYYVYVLDGLNTASMTYTFSY